MSNIKIVNDAYGRPHPVKEEELFEYGIKPDGATLGATDILSKTISVPYADLCNMYTSPITLIESPGSGKMIHIINCASVIKINTSDSSAYYPFLSYGSYFDNSLYCTVSPNADSEPGTYYWFTDMSGWSPTGAGAIPYVKWNTNTVDISNLPLKLELDGDLNGDGNIEFTINIVYTIVSI